MLGLFSIPEFACFRVGGKYNAGVRWNVKYDKFIFIEMDGVC